MRSRRRLHVVADGPAPAVDDLLVLVGRGDRAAFEALYEQVAPTVFGLARRIVRDPALAEDVAQEAMVEIWRLAPRFDPARGRAMGWIATIAHRRAVDRVRSEQAHHARNDRAADGVAVSTSGEEIGAEIERAHTRREMSTGLDQLTSKQREVIQLAFYDGRTYTEVADLLGIPVGTAKTRIRDGLIKLRDAIASVEGTP